MCERLSLGLAIALPAGSISALGMSTGVMSSAVVKAVQAFPSSASPSTRASFFIDLSCRPQRPPETLGKDVMDLTVYDGRDGAKARASRSRDRHDRKCRLRCRSAKIGRAHV